MADTLALLMTNRVKAIREARSAAEALAENEDAAVRATLDNANAEIERLDGVIAEVRKHDAEREERDLAAFLAERNKGTAKGHKVDTDKREQRDLGKELREVAQRKRPGVDIELPGMRETRDYMQALRENRASTVYNIGDISGAAAGEGPEVVFPTYVRELYRALYDENPILRAGARILTTDRGETMTFPVKVRSTKATDVAGNITTIRSAEGAQIAKTRGSFTTATLGQFKFAQIVQESREFAEDSSFDAEAIMGEDLGDVLGTALAHDLLLGTGTTVILGLVPALGTADLLTTAAAAGVPDYAKMMDVIYTLGEKYTANAKFMTNRANVKTLRLLKDPADHYVFAPATTPAQLDTFLGYPIQTNPEMPAWATNAKSLIFGDFSKFYIRLIRQMRVEWSTEYAFDTDLLSVKGVLRADALVRDQNAFVLLQGNTT